MTTIRETAPPNRPYRDKVHDTNDLGAGLLLTVASARTSAFDVVLPRGICEWAQASPRFLPCGST